MTAPVKEPTQEPDQEPTPPSLATSCYVPEAFSSHINSMVHWPWPEGTTQPDVNAADQDLMRVIMEVADLYVAGDRAGADQLIGEKIPTLPAEWSPVRYFEAVARQMALPVWEQYTDEQKQRGYEYAARYVRRRLYEWLRPRHSHGNGGTGDEPFKWKDLPKGAFHAYIEQFGAKTDYRRWLTQLQAYLATHPDDEVVPAQMRAIATRWQDYKEPQAFF